MKRLTIYTDGSHLKHTSGRLGIGGVLLDDFDNILSEFSEELSIEWLRERYGTSDVSNPTCEMLANLYALVKFRDLIKGCSSLTMKADYEGVQKWNTGIWKARLPYIKAIKDQTTEEIERQGLKGKIHFEWVKGHQKKSILSRDSRWNDYVDKLAKGIKEK